jgi:hypothetical protein
LLPLGVHTALIWGSRENFVAEEQAKGYVSAAAGDHVELVIVPGARHFETASPTAAWPVVLSTLLSMITRQ